MPTPLMHLCYKTDTSVDQAVILKLSRHLFVPPMRARDAEPSSFKPFFLMDWLEDLGVKELSTGTILNDAKIQPDGPHNLNNEFLLNQGRRNRTSSTVSSKPPLGRPKGRNERSMRFSSVEEAVSAARLWDKEGRKKTTQGMYSGALKCHKKSLFVRKTLYQDIHPDVGDTLTNMGVVLGKLDRIEEAVSHFELAYHVRRELYGVLHLDTATSAQNLGKALQKADRQEQSLARYKESTEIKRAVLGEKHPSVGLSLASLAGAFCKCRRYHEAQEAYREALKIFRTCKLKESSPAVQKAQTRLAEVEAERQAESIIELAR